MEYVIFAVIVAIIVAIISAIKNAMVKASIRKDTQNYREEVRLRYVQQREYVAKLESDLERVTYKVNMGTLTATYQSDAQDRVREAKHQMRMLKIRLEGIDSDLRYL